MTTDVIDVRKASPCGDQVINDAVIKIHGPELDTDLSRGDYCAELQADAELIVNALEQHLPQGVLDRVSVLLMDRMVSDYCVNLRIKK